MPTTEQLYLRALRILNDGLQHAPPVLAWARRAAGACLDEAEIPVDSGTFTLRELSLGATPW